MQKCYKKVIFALESLCCKAWDIHTKAWDVQTKACNVRFKAWDVKVVTRRKIFLLAVATNIAV